MTRDRLFRAATVISLVAALALVAQSEWSLALAVGWPWWIAWAAPVALDAYVLAAVRVRRDLGASVLVSAGSVLASHAVYAAPAVWTGVPGTGHLIWPLAAACSVVPLLVSWRVHNLDTVPDAPTDGPVVAADVTAIAAPVLAAVEAHAAPVAAARTHKPAATARAKARSARPRPLTYAQALDVARQAVTDGRVPARPSATALRGLGFGAARAGQLAAQLAAEAATEGATR